MSLIRRVDTRASNGQRASKLPVTVVPVVYHVGEHPSAPRPEHASMHSHEAHGLSVSEVPGTWCRINKGCTRGAWWRLKGPGRFLNALEVDTEVLLRAHPDLVTGYPYFLVETGYNDEYEQPTYVGGSDRATVLVEAEEEWGDRAAAGEMFEPTVQETVEWFAAPKRVAILRAAGRHPKGRVAAAALLEIANAAGLDGVWWHETLDPSRLSAPRGAIHRDKLPRWMVSQIRENSVDED